VTSSSISSKPAQTFVAQNSREVYRNLFSHQTSLMNSTRCVSVGKITRITAVAHTAEFMTRYPRKVSAERFEVIDGLIDILFPSVSVGSAGAISGLPNLAPVRFLESLTARDNRLTGLQKICVRLWELCLASVDVDAIQEAKRLQGLIALADSVLISVGVSLHQRRTLSHVRTDKRQGWGNEANSASHVRIRQDA
jgi:dihydrodipicolinate synthase/N-acetylneuraminate lyase